MRKPEAGGQPPSREEQGEGARGMAEGQRGGRKGGRPPVQRRVYPWGRRWAQRENRGAGEGSPLIPGSVCSTAWDFLIF